MEFSIWYVVVAWFIVYSLVSIGLNRFSKPGENLTLQGPLTLVHSKAGLATIDSLSKAVPRVWAVWGVIGVGTFLLGMVSVVFIMGFAVYRVLSEPSAVTLAKDPQNLVVIPGVNPFLPLDAAVEIVGALLIAMVVHELGHAIYCRIGGISIESTGLVLLGLIPSGAFVEPNEVSLENASSTATLKMVSAGVMNNIALAVLCLVVLVVVVPFVLMPASGAAIGGVLPASPAAEAGIESGTLIVGVEETDITSFAEFAAVVENSSADQLTVQTDSGHQYTIQRSVFVTGAVAGSGLSPAETVSSVNGVPVHTRGDLVRVTEQADSPFVLLTTTESTDSVKFTTGARARISGVQNETPVTVTHVDGERIHSADEFSATIDSESQRPVTLTIIPTDGTFTAQTVLVTPSEQAVTLTSGINGVTVTDVGVQQYPAEQYLGFITATGRSVWSTVLLIFFLPFGTVGGLPFNFAGFTSDVRAFYTVTPVLSSVSTLVFMGVSLLFWSVWINLNLALFNMIPTFALDGGHFLKNGLLWVTERFGVADTTGWETQTKYLYKALALVMLAAIVAVIAVPILLG